ncbi:MAG: hypothetical protein GWN58_23045 [Anaerolineae bacterium]|nr:hypothetical protein [Thermoplasmata archaeon]NIV32253.1 hypothetical protein [Anaerolineae bacterium]NIY03705.1 hypothetical protein [Thermoplasmata archaeon]
MRLAAQKADQIVDSYGLRPLLEGQPVTLYHGTTRQFAKFDLSKSREDLVKNYYGAGIFLTPSKRVAWKYADANRNIGFDPEIITEMKRINRNVGTFLEWLYKYGYERGWEILIEKLRKKVPEDQPITEEMDKFFGGIDHNAMNDIAPYIIGSKFKVNRGGDDFINIFDTRTGLPDYVYDDLDKVGLNSKKYRPKVYTVTAKAQKVLVTKSKAKAKTARQKGYDAVIFYGSDLVDNVPEVAIFDPKNVRITKVQVSS